MQNNQYIEGLLNHDDQVLKTIYTNLSSKIKKMVIQKGGNHADAADVFQDALVVLYKKARQPNFEINQNFDAYFFQVCRFIWDRKRKKKSNQTVILDGVEGLNKLRETSIEETMIKREKQQLFVEHIEKLGKTCRQLLKLYFAKKTMDEIAQKLNFKNSKTASTKKYKCIQTLKQSIKEDVRTKELSN